MKWLTENRILQNPLAGAAAGVVGVAILVGGLLAASGAASDLADAVTAVADQREAVADAEQALSDAEAALAAAAAEETSARGELEAAESQKDETAATLATVEGMTPAFIRAASDAMAEAADCYRTIGDLVADRTSQVEALLASDYSDFNELSAEYADSAAVASDQLTGFAAMVEGLPEIPTLEAAGATVTLAPMRTEASPELDVPTGKAIVTVSFPEEIPCTPWGDGGCSYSWEATLTESNWLSVEITRVGIRYWSGGSRYCASSEGEWRDASLDIPASGQETYRGRLRLSGEGTCSWALGTSLLFRVQGVDADGNRISGRATVSLEPPG